MTSPAPGDSATPLARKLGIKPGMCVWTLDAPAEYRDWLGDIGTEIELTGSTPDREPDLIHLFCRTWGELENGIECVGPHLESGPMLWVSWLKGRKAGGESPNRDAVRRALLEATDFVDVKVVSVSEEWSGLKFLRRRTRA